MTPDVVLADGTVYLRPIPDDADATLALYQRMSADSIYLRFFSPVSAPTAQQLERLTSIDYDERMALVAELGDDIVAIARYNRLNVPAAAEVAVDVKVRLTPARENPLHGLRRMRTIYYGTFGITGRRVGRSPRCMRRRRPALV